MKISLRKASFSDIEFLWYLRNQPDVYKYFRQARKTSWPEHIKWILPIILGKDNKNIYVIRESEVPIGQVRFDYLKSKKAEISISLLKEYRGKGLAAKALSLAIEKEKGTKLFIAYVHKNNTGSIKFFEDLNFKFKDKKGKWLKYVLNKNERIKP